MFFLIYEHNFVSCFNRNINNRLKKVEKISEEDFKLPAYLKAKV